MSVGLHDLRPGDIVVIDGHDYLFECRLSTQALPMVTMATSLSNMGFTAPQLKETTMTIGSRILLQVKISEEDAGLTAQRVEELMGRKPEHRFNFIQEQTAQRGGEILKELDV